MSCSSPMSRALTWAETREALPALAPLEKGVASVHQDKSHTKKGNIHDIITDIHIYTHIYIYIYSIYAI